MDERATGIVLRTHPVTETSLIVHWLTEEQGRLATVAKGARRSSSPFRGRLDLWYLCDLSFARSRRSDLHVLREVHLRETHAPLRTDLGRLRQAAYAAALVEQSTETETPLGAIYGHIRDLLGELARHPPQPVAVFAFEMKLLVELGLQPDLAEARLTPGSRQVLSKCAQASWSEAMRIRLSAPQTAELSQFLLRFLADHLERVPPGRAAAISVS
jgi:DNA repair protein RecO (recombination protein O)